MNVEKNESPLSYKTMRTFPLYFSRRFFLLCGATLIPLALIYGYHSAHILIPLCLDVILLLAALLDYTIGPSARDIHIERLLYYPLAVDRPNKIPLEIVSAGDRPVSVRIHDDYPEGCLARLLPFYTWTCNRRCLPACHIN